MQKSDSSATLANEQFKRSGRTLFPAGSSQGRFEKARYASIE